MTPSFAYLCTLTHGVAGAPLFLVPSVGCTPLSLMRLARSIVPRRPVHAFAYAGIEDDEPPHRTLPAMAAAYVDELLQVSPRGPYLLGGHCFGGVVALEMALQLEARGDVVARLALLDSIPPLFDNDADAAAAHAIEGAMRRAIESTITRTVSRHTVMEADALQRIASVIALHLSAATDYRARPLRAGVLVLRTGECDAATVEGWTRVSSGGLVERSIPGDSFALLQSPNVEAVGKCLGSALIEVNA